MPVERWLTTKEVAELLKINRNLVYKLSKEGQFASYKPDGKKKVYKESDVLSYMDKTKQGSNRIVLEGKRCAVIRCEDNKYRKYAVRICPKENCLTRKWEEYEFGPNKKTRIIIEEIE